MFFEAFTDEIEKIAKEKKDEYTKGEKALLGAGAGVGAGGAGLALHGHVRMQRAGKANRAALEEFIKAIPKVKQVEARKHLEEVMRKKNLPGEIVLRDVPGAEQSYAMPKRKGQPEAIGTPKRTAKPVFEHEIGHLRGKGGMRGAEKSAPRRLFETLFMPKTTRKDVMGRELSAWRFAEKGKERGMVRRPALKSYKTALRHLSGFRRKGLGVLGLLAGGGLVGAGALKADRRKIQEEAKKK